MKTPIRIMAATFVVLLFSVIVPNQAAACSCVPFTARQYVANADTVYLAEAGEKRTEGKHWVQDFRVFETLKGPDKKRFTWRRRAIVSPCEVDFEAGKPALLFVHKGTMSLCSGNFGFDFYKKTLAHILRLATKNDRRPRLGAVAEAVRAGTRGYRHNRRRIEIRHAKLTGSEKFGVTSIKFVARTGKDQVVLDEVVRSGQITLVRGHYDREGLLFTAVVHQPVGPRRVNGKRASLRPVVVRVWQSEN